MRLGALIAVRETATALGVSPVDVLDLADSGRLDSEDIAGRTWIVRSSLDHYLATLSEAKTR